MTPPASFARIPADLWPKDVGDLMRVGRSYDGGYVVPRCALMAAQHLISVGVNDDWSFERASVELNPALCLMGVDATTTAWYVVRRGLRFRVEYLLACLTGRGAKREFLRARMPSVFDYWRFWAEHTLIHKMLSWHAGATTVRLQDLMDRTLANGSESRVFLKIDIEGAEYALLDDIVSAGPRLTGLAMELHDVPAHRDQVTRFFAALRPHFVLVHLHANTYDGVDRDTALPKVVEATWLARSLITEPERDVLALPRPGLDQPSKYSHPQIPLARAGVPA
jgi:hypothetical protein